MEARKNALDWWENLTTMRKESYFWLYLVKIHTPAWDYTELQDSEIEYIYSHFAEKEGLN